MRNWLCKFDPELTTDNVLWHTVYCATEEEAIQLAQMVNLFVSGSFTGVVRCVG